MSVQDGTFDIIGCRFLQDEHQSGRLMEANADYMAALIFPAGVELNVPDCKPAPKKARNSKLAVFDAESAELL
ncbi:MAG: phage tail protein [Desulfovibrio sp.]|nr:phage tail protein [Desulfovibrio sp.]